MSKEIAAKLMECLDMASEARGKAETASSPEDKRFWLRMEKRWLRLVKRYQETEQLTDAWLRATPVGTVAIRT